MRADAALAPQSSDRRSPFADPMLAARCWIALALANVRYWSAVAPLVRAQLGRWRRQADAIVDLELQALAVAKLRQEHFNAEVAATLATLAPRACRRRVVEAIVALEILFDYLDGRTETLGEDPLREGREILGALGDAVDPDVDLASRYPRPLLDGDDGGYVAELVRAVREALAQLPCADAVYASAQRAAARCAEAQLRAHVTPRLGVEQAQEWATAEAAASPLRWREYLAGAAASVLAMHALIAAAADVTSTERQAQALDEVYLCIAVMSTTLDSVIDREHDLRTGEPVHVGHYEDAGEVASRLADVARHVAQTAGAAPNGAHHVMTLTGVVAYYISSPAAKAPFARIVASHMRRQLSPTILPTLLVMRIWRLAKAVDRGLRRLRQARQTRRLPAPPGPKGCAGEAALTPPGPGGRTAAARRLRRPR